jgi:hypothetical protein
MTLIVRDGQSTPVTQSLKTTVSGGEHVTHHNVDASALPTGAATEATLANLLTAAGFQARIPANGQATMAGSIPVAIASNQGAVPISAAALPLPAGAATDAELALILTQLGTLATQTTVAAINTAVGNLLTTAGFQARVPANGQAAMAASVPVTIASNQTALAVSAASLPLPTGAASETTLASLLSTATHGTDLSWVPDRASNASFTGTVFDASKYEMVWLEILLSDTTAPVGTFQVLGGVENNIATLQPLPLFSGTTSLLIHGQSSTAVVHDVATPKTITIAGASLTAPLRLLIPMAKPPAFLAATWTRTSGGTAVTGLSMRWTGR